MSKIPKYRESLVFRQIIGLALIVLTGAVLLVDCATTKHDVSIALYAQEVQELRTAALTRTVIWVGAIILGAVMMRRGHSD